MAEIIKISELTEISTISDDDVLPIVDTSELETKKISASKIIKPTDVIDNLTSTEVTKPLSANQGKNLDTRLTTAETDKLDKASVKTATTVSDTDTYSCNYVNNLNTYSTSEQKIGTWIDGKPIYRKVITGIHNDGEVLVSNVSVLITAYGQADNITGQIRLIPWVEIFDYKNYTLTVCKTSGNNVCLKSQAQDISKPTTSTTKIVIEYTKTTD